MDLEGLDDFALAGQRVMEQHDSIRAHQAYVAWVDQVAAWLHRRAPNTGLSADWLAVDSPSIVVNGIPRDDQVAWSMFRMGVQSRLRWLAGLPSHLNLLNLAAPAVIQTHARDIGRREVKLHTVARAYVDPDRIDELKNLTSAAFDLAKLIRLCEELNVCFAGECYLSIAMLTRAILDHVPPLFGCSAFAEVANSYAGSKSFKDSMLNLERSSRNIADQHLHTRIRKSETLPTVRQVDFSNDIDVLLAEIVRILKRP